MGHRKRSRRHRGQKKWNITQNRKSIQNAPQTPHQSINEDTIQHYNNFSRSDFDDTAITNLISKCKYIINKDEDNYNKITELREILNIPQRRLFSTRSPSLSADVSPTLGQDQLVNVSQTS